MTCMSAKAFIDTNLLIYAHDVDAAAKHDIARRGSAGTLERTNEDAQHTGTPRVLYECDAKDRVTTVEEIRQSCRKQLCDLVCGHDLGRSFCGISDRGRSAHRLLGRADCCSRREGRGRSNSVRGSQPW